MRRKILLIRPNSRIRTSPIPLGILYIASTLRGLSMCEVHVLDARDKRMSLKDVGTHIEGLSPHIIGISSLTYDADQAHIVARKAKEVSPQALVVLGGPYPCSYGDGVLRDEAVDIVVTGEGEGILSHIVSLHPIPRHSGKDDLGELTKIRGLIIRNNGQYINTGPAFYPDVERLEWPAWDLLDMESYFKKRRNSHNVVQYKSRCVPVLTSRGCPYQCIFCHNIFGERFRARSPQDVVDEIRWLKTRYGVEEIEFADDTFNLNLPRAKRIMELILQKGLNLKITFSNGLRADIIDEEFLDLAKDAGTYHISYGIESGSPGIQAIIGKGLDLKRASRSIEMTAERGILTGGQFILGFPEERRADVEETIRFASESALHKSSFHYLTPFPGTSLFKRGFDAVSPGHSSDYATLSRNLSKVTDDELKRLRRKAYRKFYFRPRRILRDVKVVPKNLQTLVGISSVLRLSVKESVIY